MGPSLPRLVSPTLALPPPCSPALPGALVSCPPGPKHSFMYTNTSEGKAASVDNFYFSRKCPQRSRGREAQLISFGSGGMENTGRGKKKKDLNKSARFFIPLSLPPSSLPPPDSPLPSSPSHTEAMGLCLTWSSCTPLKLHPREPPLTTQLTIRLHGRGRVPCALRWSAGLRWVGGHVGPGASAPSLWASPLQAGAGR